MIFGSLIEPYIIAEIGANHNGDMKLAGDLIKAAKDAGADCVKFQSWTKESIFAEVKYEENYFLKDDYRDRSDFTLAEIVEKFSVSEQELIELKSMADSLSMDFSCTPFSFEEAKFVADKLDVRFIKVASMDANNYPFLDFVARLGKPVMISTGLCTLAEIDRAVSVFENAGNKNLAILHCVAEYPPEDSQINLRNIDTIKKCYPEYTVGFSDHSIGVCVPLAAVAIGAKIIEKHFTLDKEMFGWDHKVSATPEELRDICTGGQRIVHALGSSRILATESEERKREFRRSIVTTRAIMRGEVFGFKDLTFKRPGTGLSPEFVDLVIGRVAKRDLKKDQVISDTDF